MSQQFDLGPWRRSVTTASAEAQAAFDDGLNWTYAFNHEEAVVCFRRAVEADPGCAMAWWGIAYAGGPFYNRAWVRYSVPEIETVLPPCYEAACRALALADRATPVEQALIRAVGRRYQSPETRDHATLNRWQDDYTQAMREAHAAWPDDLDVAALFAEAAITRTPRQLWDLRTGAPKPGADTEEALAVLERALATIEATGTPHPGILHMHIHLMEMSRTPERALRAADMLRGYAPDAGHLEHMPAHIYVLCGDYAQAVEQSRRTVIADDKYLLHAGANNFYTTARCHDLHLYMYAANFLGQYRQALYAAERVRAGVTPDLLAWSPPFMRTMLDGLSAMHSHVQVRFGQWQALTREPAPGRPDLRPIGTAMHAYGQGVAHAALGGIADAQRARTAFHEAKSRVPDDAIFLSNRVTDMLAVGEAMLDGEIEYRLGNHARAFGSLRLAVERDDNLNYTEPWAWMHPPRHALGALLLEQGHIEEAEAVYRADLGYDDSVPRCCQHPDNVWALHGLLECIERRGEEAESHLLRQRLLLAQARTDVPIVASCCCRAAAPAQVTATT